MHNRYDSYQANSKIEISLDLENQSLRVEVSPRRAKKSRREMQEDSCIELNEKLKDLISEDLLLVFSTREDVYEYLYRNISECLMVLSIEEGIEAEIDDASKEKFDDRGGKIKCSIPIIIIKEPDLYDYW